MIEKQPSEETTIGLDVSGLRELQAGEDIQAITVASTLDGAPADVIQSHDMQGNIIRIRLHGGVSGKAYKITITIQTSMFHSREVDILLLVQER